MVENRSSIFGTIAIILGASGLGLGMFSVINFQVVTGPQGSPGQDGRHGQLSDGWEQQSSRQFRMGSGK